MLLRPGARSETLLLFADGLASLLPVRALAFICAAICAASCLAMSAPSIAQGPPAQVRVIFTTDKITRVDTLGMADPAERRAVTIDDPVRIASISKLYVALGVMRLVDQKRIDLDRDVSDYLGWRLRNPAFPEAKIALRLLLSHQSSVSDNADYLMPVSYTVRAKMADPKAWDAQHPPGSGWFHYTNLNFPIVASVMEAATGQRFDQLMDRLVMKPLRLGACFNWSGCTEDHAKRAVILYRASGEVAGDDLKGKLPDCPGIPAADGSCDLTRYTPGWNGGIFSPQGGLRISARDLAKTGQMLLRSGKGFLSKKAFAELVGPQWRWARDNGNSAKGFFCTYGLAMQTLADSREASCSDDPFGDGAKRIGHAGEAYGLKSGLWVDRMSGKGMAWFITAVPDDAPRGSSAFYAVEEAIIAKP